jgi:hypothetical protein
MQIEQGKTYITRMGAKVGPMVPNPNPQNSITYPWVPEPTQGANYAYMNDGRFHIEDQENDSDLVSEYPDCYAQAASDALAEVRRARDMFGPMASMHEGYAVLLEELDEVWDIVKMKQRERPLHLARKEMIQVAAMALAFAVEVCTEERGRR